MVEIHYWDYHDSQQREDSEGGEETAIKRLLLTNAELIPRKNENGFRTNHPFGYFFSFILTVV
jgi:hypothetical protein